LLPIPLFREPTFLRPFKCQGCFVRVCNLFFVRSAIGLVGFSSGNSLKRKVAVQQTNRSNTVHNRKFSSLERVNCAL